MSSTRPLLTVAIHTYNSGAFLPDSIGSILNQGIEDLEILVVDNASQDNTEEVVRSIPDKRIRFYKNGENLGACVNANRCISLATGIYYKPLCADDVLVPGILRMQLEALQRERDVSLVTCNMQVTDEALNPTSICRLFPGHWAGSRIVQICLTCMTNYVGGPSNFMVRYDQTQRIGFDPSYRFINDLRYGLRILELGNYLNIGEVGYKYRRHQACDTNMSCPEDARLAEFVRLAEEFGLWNPLSLFRSIRRDRNAGKAYCKKHFLSALRPGKVVEMFEVIHHIGMTRSMRI